MASDAAHSTVAAPPGLEALGPTVDAATVGASAPQAAQAEAEPEVQGPAGAAQQHNVLALDIPGTGPFARG